MANTRRVTRTATHWGAYDVHVENDRVVALEPFASDPDPAVMGPALADAVHHPTRIAGPMVRKGWLEGGPDRGRKRRGGEPFVPVTWEVAFDLVAGELERVRRDHGNPSIYAGSYGWASAGRFHHAQSQLHRFMNVLGGCTRSRNSYSTAAAEVILRRVVAPWSEMETGQTSWSSIASEGELFVAFGGLPLKNAQVAYGGIVDHPVREGMRRSHERGVRFVTFGPLRDDTPAFLDHEWLGRAPAMQVGRFDPIAARRHHARLTWRDAWSIPRLGSPNRMDEADATTSKATQMTAPKTPAARSRLDRLVSQSQAAGLWERAWPLVWRALAVVLAFLAASWLGLWLDLSPFWRIAGLAAFAPRLPRRSGAAGPPIAPEPPRGTGPPRP